MKSALRILTGLGLLALSAAAAGTVKRASFAGQFYEKEPVRLAASIDAALARAAPAAAVDGKIIALIAPHAGYVYSGGTAASAYALVKGRPIETVVVIGPSHQVGFRGCSIWPKGGFETPLGIARVDEDLARAIMKASGFRFQPEAFAKEHSVEVQIPFIQRALPEAAIVPIVMGYQDRRTIETLAGALAKTCLDRDILIVASTDLSHFLSKEEALSRDAATADLIRSLETEALIRKIEAGENIMCGGGPVVSALLLARKAGRPRVEILQRTDSAGFGGPVVGYLAAAVLSDNGTEAAPLLLSSDDKSALLRLARSSIEEYVERGRIIDPPGDNPKFLIPRGVFVTIKKQGRLRGCIGFSEPVMPLGPAVIRASVLAAVKDSRFPPVDRAELRDLRIELSVLTPPEEIDDFRAVRVGRHGLIVTQGEKTGLLLPQVPVDNGWNRRTFLQQASLKAGLPADAWRRGATLHVFETVVFHE
jgi:MEMO1 family protein